MVLMYNGAPNFVGIRSQESCLRSHFISKCIVCKEELEEVVNISCTTCINLVEIAPIFFKLQ